MLSSNVNNPQANAAGTENVAAGTPFDLNAPSQPSKAVAGEEGKKPGDSNPIDGGPFDGLTTFGPAFCQ